MDEVKWFFFSEIKPHEFSNRDFMFSIFATLIGDLFKRIIYNSKIFIAIDTKEVEYEFVKIRKKN